MDNSDSEQESNKQAEELETGFKKDKMTLKDQSQQVQQSEKNKSQKAQQQEDKDEVDMMDEYDKYLAKKEDENEEKDQLVNMEQEMYEEAKATSFLKDKYDYSLNKQKLREKFLEWQASERNENTQ